ncbi:hypothetical protein EON63_11110 [archaeon]|nr:MAG: hypothetical protein EON63_11110 [archaeon]
MSVLHSEYGGRATPNPHSYPYPYIHTHTHVHTQTHCARICLVSGMVTPLYCHTAPGTPEIQ